MRKRRFYLLAATALAALVVMVPAALAQVYHANYSNSGQFYPTDGWAPRSASSACSQYAEDLQLVYTNTQGGWIYNSGIVDVSGANDCISGPGASYAKILCRQFDDSGTANWMVCEKF